MTDPQSRLNRILEAHPCLVGEGEVVEIPIPRVRVDKGEGEEYCDPDEVAMLEAELRLLREEVARLREIASDVNTQLGNVRIKHATLREAAQRVVDEPLYVDAGESMIAAVRALAALLKGQ